MRNPMNLVTPRRQQPPRGVVRPAGAIDPTTAGLILEGFPAGVRVAVSGQYVTPDGDGFVQVIPLRRTAGVAHGAPLEVSNGTETRLAFIGVKSAPPRRIRFDEIPVVLSVGEPVEASGLARVELVAFAPDTRVLVNGWRPGRMERDEASGIVSVWLPSRGATLYVEQPEGTAGMTAPGQLRLDLAPGEVLDLFPDDFPATARRSTDPFRIPLSDAEVATEAPTPAPTAPATMPPATTAPPTPATTASPTPAPTSSMVPAHRPVGVLEVAVNAPDATVMINGVRLAGPPFRRELPPGTYELFVSAPGHEPRTAPVTIAADLLTPANVALTPVQAPVPTVLLVAGGVVAVAAVALLAASLLTPKPEPDEKDGKRREKVAAKS